MTGEAEVTGGGASPPGLVDRVARGLAIFGGLFMLAAAFMVTTSVLLRWLFRSGVQGDFEMVQIATAVAVFAFLPLCQLNRGNVFVDTFTLRTPARLNRFLDRLWDGLYAGFALLIGWRLIVGGLDAIASRTSSMVLAIPIGWAILATGLMAFVLAGATLVSAQRLSREPS
ncbi:MAG: TRAP transporter small permease [Phreatobacter sp.]|uniref:TRAP transporter small permease n=1 Tax=Phreatobacter sp. TaxID=1966341 RepID=UPI0027323B4C|nr:TRAP transporter small permease [Phreatobacter sp.]MDP2803156.1 TRAP transporter small permease [Phreatobacter sp.]